MNLVDVFDEILTEHAYDIPWPRKHDVIVRCECGAKVKDHPRHQAEQLAARLEQVGQGHARKLSPWFLTNELGTDPLGRWVSVFALREGEA